jgi:lipopolysaccharide export system permease protein
MRILDRYILKSVLSVFLTCFFTFLFLYIIIDVFANLDDILKQHVTMDILGPYYLSYIPVIFVQLAPIACILATLYTFGKLNRDNEIIAMRSSGLSILQISRTVIIFGFLISIAVFFVNDRFVPESWALNQRMRNSIGADAKKIQQKEKEAINNLSMYGLKNRLFFINRFLLATNTMEGIVILEHNEHQSLTRKIVANKGVYKDGLWRFYQAITYDFDENGQIKEEPRYSEEEIMPISETPQEFLNQRKRPEFMNIAQINNYIWRLSKSGASTVLRNLKVDLYERLTMPITSLIMVLIGVPFSLKMKKRATGLSAMGLAMTVGFLYYVLNAVSIALGKAGVLSPFLGVSISHILVFLVSLYLITTLP